MKWSQVNDARGCLMAIDEKSEEEEQWEREWDEDKMNGHDEETMRDRTSESWGDWRRRARRRMWRKKTQGI